MTTAPAPATSAPAPSSHSSAAFEPLSVGPVPVFGETTAGAANAGRGYPINDTFEIIVSNGQLLTSVSRRSWEGAGVAPDVAVAASAALSVAHLRAIDDLLAALPAGARRAELNRVRAQISDRPQ